jgi:cytochrome c oxidase subunit II
MYQMIALYLTVFFEFLLALAFAFVYGESKRTSKYGAIQEKGYTIRKYYFIGLVAVMGIATYLTLDDLPYHSAHAKETASDETKVVEVVGLQYYWEMSEESFTVGDKVEFKVTAKDVTHGFGLYDGNLELVAQTQAMPEYENSVYYTFEKPGTYKILCLEYCSVGHHVMIKEIIVKPEGGQVNGN